MGLPLPLVTSYERIVRDVARQDLPPGAVWNMIDMIPDYDGLARARGSLNDTATLASAGTNVAPRGVGFLAGLDISVDPRIYVVGSNKTIYEYSVGGTTTAGTVGFEDFNFPCSRFVQAGANIFFAPRGGTAQAIMTTTAGNPFSSVTNSPTNVVDIAVFNDFLVAVGSDGASNGNRVWFSSPGWTSFASGLPSYIDAPSKINGVAALHNVILLFCEDAIYRITGNVPPGNGPSNMSVDLLAPNMRGVVDSRSIVSYQSGVVFANDQGIFFSNGVTLNNLTEKGGMEQYWRRLSEQAFQMVAWIHKGYYFISVYGTTPDVAPIDTLVCDVNKNAWFRMSNMDFRGGACFAQASYSGADDIAAALPLPDGSLHLVTLASIFEVSEVGHGSGVDPGGVAIKPTIETGFLRGFMRLHRKWIPSWGQQVWRYLYPTYDLTGGGQLNVQYAITPETDADGNVAYANLPNWNGGYLPATTGRTRSRIPLEFAANGVAFKLTVTGTGWTSFRMDALECEFYPRETSRIF